MQEGDSLLNSLSAEPHNTGQERWSPRLEYDPILREAPELPAAVSRRMDEEEDRKPAVIFDVTQSSFSLASGK